MSMLKRPALAGTIAVLVIAVLAFGGVITAQTPNRFSSAVGATPPGDLPPVDPVERGEMTITRTGDAQSVLSFDDGSCEGGLGVGSATWTGVVDFDVPTQCIQAGLDIVGLTARINTNSATALAFAQSGATPPAAGSLSTVGIAGIAGVGPCPATGGFATRAIGPGAAVITGTSNFFAGFRSFGAFGARDTGVPAGRIWALCATCTNTQYSPAALTGIGLGGNWMIRVTVEDQNCVPVELMDFSVIDG